jgi:hypothetical protein
VFTKIEHGQNMNNETTLLETAAAHLRGRELMVDVKGARRDEPIDAWFRITKDKQHVDYAVEIKRQVTQHTLGAVVAQLKQRTQTFNRPLLLVTNYITPPVADRLIELGQQFVDAAGNVYLTGPGIFMVITGRKPVQEHTLDKPGRAHTTAGLKVIFAFICDPELATRPYREIAPAADVALGVLPAVLAGLQQIAHLRVMGNKRRLVPTKRLLDDWALAYARTLRPKQLLRTLVAPTFAAWRTWQLDADQAKWGAEPAAALITKYIEPGVLTLYAKKLPARLMVAQRMTTARPDDAHALVEVRKPFWGETLRNTDPGKTVPNALVYADLLATGDARCIEAAQMLYEDNLARLFPAT